VGIVVGIAAAWLGLPPLTIRSWVPSLVLALIAVMLGIGVAIRGERRFGGFAIAAGLFGFGIAFLATFSSVGKLESVVVWSALLAAMLRFATPLAFAALGGMFSERSGVVNIGLEGMMLMGAFFGIMGADKLDSWWLGLLCGILAGGAAAFVHAVWAIHLQADQIVSGTAINFLAVGLTGYLFIDIYGSEGTPTDIPSIPNIHLGFLGDGFVGDIFGRLNLMIWIAIVLVPLTWAIMFKTPIGLRIRACGEHPRAADTVGISVYGVRYGAVTLSGMLAAAGGAYLSIGFVNSFNENMTAGRGFIALAALIFGNWRPFGAAAACLLFGFSSALAQRLPEYSQSASVLFQALPYVLTLIAVAGVIGRSIPPAAVGRPYKKQ
jgi:simple sugar transport system permease protein